jgi:GT2 family glycosyltransferase
VVLNWNLPQTTAACVRRLRAMTYPNLTLVVVDNGSTDGSAAFLANAFPEVTLLALPENRGFAGGNNAGMAHALASGAEWVLLVNNDALLAPDALAHLLAAARPGVGLITPRIDILDGDVAGAAGTGLRPPDGGAGPVPKAGSLWHAGARLRWWNPLPYQLSERELGPGDPFAVDFAVGCVLLVHRSVFERIGLFDERYFMYYEDLDFCTRARAAEFAIVVAPRARAWHEGGASLKHASARRLYLLTRYRVIWSRSQPLSVAGFVWWLTMVLHLYRCTAATLWARQPASLAAVYRGLFDAVTDAQAAQPRIPRIG